MSERERKIVDAPLFQRLRRVHQLALTKYVYPTAEHSRFVHSLGTLQSATKIFLGLLRKSESDIFAQEDHTRLLTLLRFASLLHDIGHLPFSHATEKVLLSPARHEDVSRFVIKHYNPIAEVLQDDANIVESILSGEVIKRYEILPEIISGDLDADRTDYLLRDSYYCGVKYGEYDFPRYSQSFGVESNKGGLRLIINESDVFVAESLLIARYHYNLQVPYHRTRTGFDLALNAYLREKQEGGCLELPIHVDDSGNIESIDFDSFELFDDYSMFEMIKRDYVDGNNWAAILLRQDHLRCVFDEVDDGNSIDLFEAIKARLEESWLAENRDYFLSKENIWLFKRKSEKHASEDDESNYIYVKKRTGELVPLHEYSSFLKNNVNVRLLRIYTTRQAMKDVKSIIEEARGWTTREI